MQPKPKPEKSVIFLEDSIKFFLQGHIFAQPWPKVSNLLEK